MKTALVCGVGGMIGGHLGVRLKQDGFWVRGVDLNVNPWLSMAEFDEFQMLDLRRKRDCYHALSLPAGEFDQVYQLSADMGGMGFISANECEIMRNNVLINVNMVDAAAHVGVKRYFFSSSACVYRNQKCIEPPMTEDGAYPAMPDNEYGWEKLYSERMIAAYARSFKFAPRIARFQNCYGEMGCWTGGREKAPAAICRKVAMAEDGGEVEIWGDGTAVRSYIHVSDLVDGVRVLMESDVATPTNIGSDEYVSVDELVRVVAKVAGKGIRIKHVNGPVGVESRNFSNERMHVLGWTPKLTLEAGIKRLYPWVAKQVKLAATKA